MHVSPQLKLLLALLLTLSVGGKVIASGQSLRGLREMMQSTAKGQIAAFLERHGLRVVEVGGQPDSPFVLAAGSDCRLLVVLAAPQGWHSDITRRFALPGDHVFFVFDGVMYQEQPAWLPWVHHYWRVLNLHVGRKLPTRPVLGTVASPACNLQGLPWQEIAELP